MTATVEALALLAEFPPNARAKSIVAKLRQRRTTERLRAEAPFVSNAGDELDQLCLSALERELLGEGA